MYFMYISIRASHPLSAPWPRAADAYCMRQCSSRVRLGAGCCSYVSTHCRERERVLDVGANLKEPSGGLLGGGGVWVTNRKCGREPVKIETSGFGEASHELKYSSHSAIPPGSKESPSSHRN